MATAPEIREIEARAEIATVAIDDVLERCGVARTTWWRWKEGQFEPRLSTLRKVREALEAAIAEKRAA